MQEVNNEIEIIRAWLSRIVSHWHWYLLCAIVFGLYGVYDYFSTNYEYEVKSEIMLRGVDNGSAYIQPELADMLGLRGKKSVDDEIAVLTSRDAVTRVIKDLGLQVDYRKKDGLRWVEQYPNTDLSIVTSDGLVDKLRLPIVVQVKARKDDYVVNVESGPSLQSKHIVESLTSPIQTCVGELSFEVMNTNGIIAGNQYKVTIYPLVAVVNAFKRNLKTAPLKRDSKIIGLTVTSDAPKRACDFVEKLIETYNSDVLDDKNIVAQNTAAFIEDRMSAVEQELKQTEDRTVQYLGEFGLVNPEIEVELFLNEDIEYRKQLVDITTQIHVTEYLSNFLEIEANKDSLLPAMFMIPVVNKQSPDQTKPAEVSVSNIALTAAIDEYNAMMLKKMRAQRGVESYAGEIDVELATLRSNIIETVKTLRKTLLISQQDIEKQIERTSKHRLNMPEHVRFYEKMVREKTLLEELYLLIGAKREENALVVASNIMPIKVVTSPQIIPVLVSPKYASIALFLLIGLALPLGIMIVYYMINNKISSESKDLDRRLNFPVVGALAKKPNTSFITVRDGDDSLAAELFRTLRTNVQFLQSSNSQSPVLLVTSSINNEGKTYVSSNLAASFALLGKKVVLVDLDMRRPKLATVLELPSQGCLTNYLKDSALSLKDVIIPSAIANLDVIPAGSIPSNPSELLQNEKLDELFANLRKQYDYIVVDSASLAVVSDTYMLGRLADLTICVTRTKTTTFDMLELLNKTYNQNRLPNMVAILNGVDTVHLRH